MDFVLLIVGLVGGGASGFVARQVLLSKKNKDTESQVTKLLESSKTKAKEIILQAKEEALAIGDAAKKEERERRDQILELEKRVAVKEENIDRRFDELEKSKAEVTAERENIEKLKDDIRAIRAKLEEGLAKVARMTKDQAKKKLMEITEKEIRQDLVELVRKMQEQAQEEAKDKARKIIVDAIEQNAADVTTETVVTTVELPNEELKGRVIGKEGRNIQTIERLTGVDVIVDDTPGVIVLSSFDPVRRQVARIALEKLLADGRIHPTNIEEQVKKAEKAVEESVKESGEKAVRELGITGLHPEIINLIGQLKYRTSFGQTVLDHSLEVAHVATRIAEEVGADVRVVKIGAICHDLGKAVTHIMEGQHHHLSRHLLEKYGVEEAICHAAEAHHDDIPADTVEALCVKTGDHISGGRPGARRDTVENYVKRLQELENVANSFEGVDKSFAIQAGREIRVMVTPEEIDDLEAIKLARDIATKIEATLKYPGVVKVNVIRETRAIEYAK